jgi:hypothetical protein
MGHAQFQWKQTADLQPFVCCAICVQFKERVVRVSSTGEHVVAAEGLASCVALVPAVAPVWPAPCMIPAPMREALLHCIAADAENAAAK